jgi:hypothetical protein
MLKDLDTVTHTHTARSDAPCRKAQVETKVVVTSVIE